MKTRITIIVILGCLLLSLFILVGIHLSTEKPKSMSLKEFTDARKVAIDLRVKANENYANLATLLLGFLWVVLLSGKSAFSRIEIRHSSGYVLFGIANFSYALSIFSNFLWKIRLSNAYWDICIKDKVPSIVEGRLANLMDYQFYAFILGILSTFFLMTFCYERPERLFVDKEEKNENKSLALSDTDSIRGDSNL